MTLPDDATTAGSGGSACAASAPDNECDNEVGPALQMVEILQPHTDPAILMLGQTDDRRDGQF